MITLTGQREIARCNVYHDDVDPLLFYIMPQSPRIALDDTGKPIFSLVQYRRDVSKLTDDERRTKLGGGILSLSCELSTNADQMKEIRKELADDPALQARTGMDKDHLEDAVKVGTLPVLDGTVGIAILAETSGEGGGMGEFVASLVGVGHVSMTGRERASFAAKLTMDGAALLWSMVERNLPGIRVAYDLKFNHRLSGVRMTVWCDARKAFHAMQDQWHHLSDDASWSERHWDGNSLYTYSDDQSDNARNRIFTALTASESSRVDIIQEAGDDVIKPELIAQLTQLGNEMIKDFIASTFLEYKPGTEFHADEEPELKTELATQNGKKYGHDAINQYNLKNWDESMSATLNYQFRTQQVLTGHLGPNDNLANVLSGRDVKELRAQIDIDSKFFKYLDVQMVCTADFDNDPVDLVKAHLAYHGTGPNGPIDKVADFVFRKGSAPARFSTYLATPDQLSYTYQCQVFYKGAGAGSYSFSGKSDETILVFDVDQLGILRVDVQMGVVDWTQITTVLLKMWYGSGSDRKETEFVLDNQHQSASWVEVIGSPVDGAYGYQVTWVDKGGQRMVGDPQTGRGRRLVLSQEIGESLEVAVVPAGSYGPGGLISQIVVALRYLDERNDYHKFETLTFAKEGEGKVWKVPLVDKTLRIYQYKVTVFYSDGLTRESDWETSDLTVLAAGDKSTYKVTFLPYLLKGPTWAFGTINVRYDDPATNLHVERTLELKDFATPLTWRFRIGAPDRHNFRYQVTLYRAADGAEFRQPETEDTKEVLVLRPPTT